MPPEVWLKSDRAHTKPGDLLDAEACSRARAVIRNWTFYQPSPVRDMHRFASMLGVASVLAIDESQRLPLKSIKMLGAAYALAEAVAEWTGVPAQDVYSVAGNAARPSLHAHRVVAATDGNHGAALAWAAQQLGIACSIYLPADVSAGRENRIGALGADTVRCSGTYEDAVNQAYADACEHGWTIIQDTALEGFAEHCLNIMYGYTMLMDEALQQLAQRKPTHVFVQVGVGGIAAATVSYLRHAYGAECPKIIAVESVNANCLAQSLAQGERVTVAGPHHTGMGGIACGEVSEIAWRVLKHSVDAAVSLQDEAARRSLQSCLQVAPEVEIGETGIAGLAAMQAVCEVPELREQLGIDASSTLFGLITEGITDAVAYQAFLHTS